MTYNEFLDKLQSIVSAESTLIEPEEEYYRKLLFQVEKHAHEKPTTELLLKVFQDSLTGPASEFDPAWNSIEEPLVYVDEDVAINKAPIDSARETIKFFIADLRRMGSKVLDDPYRSMGVTSSSGARWYNFDISSIIFCYTNYCNDAMVTVEDESEGKEERSVELGWGEIADILLFGKEYE